MYRWGSDEPRAENVPDGLRFSDTAPGGFESLDCTLARKPGTDYADLERLSTLRVLGAGGDVAWEGRLERAPRTSGQTMGVSPSAVGWQAHLDDDKSAAVIFIDRDMNHWADAPLTRRAQLAVTGVGGGKIPVSRTGGIVWEVPAEALSAAEETDLVYDAGPGVKVARLDYRGVRTGASWAGSFQAPFVFSSDDDAFVTGVTFASLTLDNAGHPATALTARRYLMLTARTTSAVTPAAGHQQRFDVLNVIGDHGLTMPASSIDGFGGVLASDAVAYAVDRWAPLLTTSVGPSMFVVPHLVFREPTTAAEIVRQATRYGLQDWAVWEDKTFHWHERGARGRRWRARIGPAQLEETGPQVDRLWESSIVQYQDVDGSTRTVGPPGSGADTEDAVLKDDDPENPANKLGIIRRDLLTMGVSTAAGATEIGRRFLEQTKLLDSSGRARIVGHVMDDRGVMHPYWRVRAGDYISFVDSASTGYRRIVRSEKSTSDRSCTIDLDAPPDGLAALLERLGVGLVSLGL